MFDMFRCMQCNHCDSCTANIEAKCHITPIAVFIKKHNCIDMSYFEKSQNGRKFRQDLRMIRQSYEPLVKL